MTLLSSASSLSTDERPSLGRAEVLDPVAPHPEHPERALGMLYMKHRHNVYRLALRYSAGNSDWAEDVTQEVFLIALRKLRFLHDVGDLGGWFYRVTTNHCLKKLKQDRLRSNILLSALFGESESAPSPESTIMHRQELGSIEGILRSLGPKQRVVFCMYHLDGVLQPQIAETLGLSKGYVCKLLAQASALVQDLHPEVVCGP